MFKSLLQGFSVLVLSTAVAGSAQSGWVGTWAASAMPNQGAKSLTNATEREIVHLSQGGDKVRVRFTNEYGTEPLTIEEAHVALSAGGAAIQPGTDRKLTFGGAASIQLAPGAVVTSDPVALTAPALSNLAISLFVPVQPMHTATYHALAVQTNYSVPGNQTAAETLSEASKSSSWYLISGVDVPATADARAIVTFGDSITDGARSTNDANRRWPNVLAERLQQTKGLEHVSVLDEGISGNRVLNEGAGPSALARFDRDVLAQDGVKYLIILESINDIGHTLHLSAPEDEITADQLKFALSQMVERAHAHGIKVYGATLTPYVGAGYSSGKGEQMRAAVNQWIRTSGVFDAVIDFEKATGDGQTPPHFNPAYDSGDHLHPGDAGYKAMGEAIDLNLFK
ncbi:SGNH/GDSL hydrolase family protein [Telmatobacter bradus]|uniref:SGNH/GDSL hydrolase family protein n=1 Tax=Telmatobacter bradus TaxID=474953 RepID=UPI003B435B5A